MGGVTLSKKIPLWFATWQRVRLSGARRLKPRVYMNTLLNLISLFDTIAVLEVAYIPCFCVIVFLL